MPATCAAYNCGIRRSRGAGISFHRFPMSNPLLLKKWLRGMKKDFIPNRHSILCSNHFAESDLDRSRQTVRLREGAVPSVFDSPSDLPEDLATTQKHGRDTDTSAVMGRVGKRDYGKAHTSVAESKELGKHHPTPKSGVPVRQFLIKDHACVFSDKQEVELVKCIKEADVFFDEMTTKETRKLVYEFAFKYNAIIPNPLWDFDGLVDVAWFKKFVQRHPSISRKKQVNSNVIRKIGFNSRSINYFINTVPDKMRAVSSNKSKFINKENPFECYSSLEHKCNAIPENHTLNNLYASKNDIHVKHECLYNNTSDKVARENVFIRNVYQGKKSENCEGILNEVNAERKGFVMDNCAFVKEEKDTIVKEENYMLSSDDACVQKYGLLKEEDNLLFCNKISCKNEVLVKEECVFIKEEMDDFV
nr:uncharacterized protein LOC123747355 [Procambarus clarkii]XP_045585471.1 uncharacterized protein LOC123747355 [Procambarus clarkii]